MFDRYQLVLMPIPVMEAFRLVLFNVFELGTIGSAKAVVAFFVLFVAPRGFCSDVQ